jgi:type VI secretion system protein ImpA
MLDLEALLVPVEENPPAGPDLEYDAEWQALERLAQGKPEQQFGDTIIPAEEPDWTDVANRATALLARSKDIRSAALLALGNTRLEQFPGLSQSLQLILQMLERYWDSVHPMLDASDGDDPTMRLNALSALADPQGLLRLARTVRLSTARGHELTMREVEMAAGKIPVREGETAPAQDQIDRQIGAMIAEDPSFAPLVADTFAAAKSLSQFLDDRVGSDRSPDFKPLIGALYVLNQTVSRLAAAAAAIAEVDPATGEAIGGEAGGGGGGPGLSTSGAVRSRQDVVILLDKISEFLQRTEPTNPVPLILARAKRLMEMNFIELLQEIAPDGLVQAKNVAGIRDEQ